MVSNLPDDLMLTCGRIAEAFTMWESEKAVAILLEALSAARAEQREADHRILECANGYDLVNVGMVPTKYAKWVDRYEMMDAIRSAGRRG